MPELKNSLLHPGDVFEKYTVEQELGHGGMGAVYLVRHRVLNTSFALKVLYPGVAQRDQQFVDRFIREAQLAGRIRHPNLIAVYDAGLNESSGMYYLVMDYVSGGSVRSKLRKQVHLSVLESLGIVRQVGHALEAALQHNMVHRDIKPDNIMFDADGVARLADLGLAKATGDNDVNLTVEAAVFGTPSYMSPEQARDSRNVDIRADIYSLGIVLFEMLTGRRPFTGENSIEILTQVISDTPAPDVRTLNPDIPEAVAVLVADMIQKDLQKRIASPFDLISHINFIISNLENSGGVVAEQPEAKMTFAQPVPSQPQAAPPKAKLTPEMIAQPSPVAQKALEPVANQSFKRTIAVGTEGTPSASSMTNGGMDKRKLMIIGGGVVGLLLVIGGGAILMKSGKETEKSANQIETSADNGGNDAHKIVEMPQSTELQPLKTDVEPLPKIEEQPATQIIVNTEPKVEEQPAAQVVAKPEEKKEEQPVAQPVVNTEPKVEEQPVAQIVAHPEEKKEEQPVAQVVAHPEEKKEEHPIAPPVVNTEPKVEEQPVAQVVVQAGEPDAAAIQANITFFGADNAENGTLLKTIQKMTGEQNTTFQKAGLSSRTKGDLLRIQSGKPDLLLIAVTSRYETMSLSNFELFVADLCESLRSRGGNYAFVLEPIAGKSARFCNGNNTVRELCRQRSINVIDCENGEIKADDIKMLLTP